RWKRARRVAVRLFVAYSVVYTLTGLLFDHWGTQYVGLSEAACDPILVRADSHEELEQLLAEEFVPTLVFSIGEPTDLTEEVVVPYQLVRDPDDPGRYVWRAAVAYSLDYGASASSVRVSLGAGGRSFSFSKPVVRLIGLVFGLADLDAHFGDVEMFEIYLAPSQADGYWEIDRLVLFPHGKAKTYDAGDIRCFRDSPVLYVSRGKHAMFPSLQECNHNSVAQRRGLHLIAEHCSVGTLYYPTVSAEFDVGDSSNPVNIFATSPSILSSEVFRGEDAWADCFWGGHRDDESHEDKPCRARFRWW
ncbi:MAG: hypothetical protein LC121_25910, partial [Anaerolineae bacterium]|nr:hypothetical protein [Anaerolineae bacterium]